LVLDRTIKDEDEEADDEVDDEGDNDDDSCDKWDESMVLFPLSPCFAKISGAMKASDPQKPSESRLCRCHVSQNTSATPKSVNFRMLPSPLNSRFSGLTSLKKVEVGGERSFKCEV
jgi:hypothetical protein